MATTDLHPPSDPSKPAHGGAVHMTDTGTPPPCGQFAARVPRRRRNADVRSREYLTPEEVERLIAAARRVGRHGHRDATSILIAYRHGLRVGELISLRWEQVDLEQGLLHVVRSKNGTSSNHPLGGSEIRALRRLRRDYTDSRHVFITERGAPMTASNVRKMIARAGRAADFPFPTHPHMLRHADRTPGFEPRTMWENEHITRRLPQTRRAVFGSAIDAA